jgi:hypothetical protein
MTVEELNFVRDTIENLVVDSELFSWGPSYEIMNREKKRAISILNREIKEQKKKDGIS